MTIQKMDIKSYELLLLNDFELKSCNGGGWLKYAWKAFQALEIADGSYGVLLSACQSHELSADTYINKRFIGAFTHYLIENLNKYSETKNMKAIIELVNKDLEKNGYDQSPQSEGLLENNLFFL